MISPLLSAREEGFNETFIGENMWRAVRIRSSMQPKLKYVAAYQIAPVSAITYVAEVSHVESWKDTGKYAIHFRGPA